MFETPCFHGAAAISLSVTNTNSLTPNNSFRSIESFEQISSACFFVWKVFIFFFCLPLPVYFDNQVSVPSFSYVFWLAFIFIAFLYEERGKLSRAEHLPEFHVNESGYIRCLIFWIWFWENSFCFFIWRRHNCCLFFAGSVLPHPLRSQTFVCSVRRGKLIRLSLDDDTRPVYSSWK